MHLVPSPINVRRANDGSEELVNYCGILWVNGRRRLNNVVLGVWRILFQFAQQPYSALMAQ